MKIQEIFHLIVLILVLLELSLWDYMEIQD